MASSNRHWPSMFKSKPCNVHHQWHHDINASLMSVPCHRPSCNTGPSGEERNPEPKPRWNPKPEQIRILESIFNSGLVNPPRDEIRKIRTQLQEYGQVGDANVFYWFQNRKSRSKNKQRQLQSSKAPPSSTSANAVAAMSTPTTTATSSSSSSSDKSSPGIDKSMAISVPKSNPFIPDPSIPTTYVNYLNFNSDYSKDPLLFPVQQHSGSGLSEWFQFSEQGLLNELINHGGLKRMDEELKMKDNCVSTFHPFPSATAFVAAATTNSTTATTTTAAVNEIQGIGDIPMGLESSIVTARLTVFINDVAFEIPSGPLNVREFFGDETVLLHSSGQPVVIDEWGVTLNSLQHGNSYYLVRL